MTAPHNGAERSGEALILDIQRLSTEDGPGMRTTVFFKGCNLRCPWCHNPESIASTPDIGWHKQRCIGCGLCGAACRRGGLRRGPAGITFEREVCAACLAESGTGGGCTEECPAGAIEVKGRRIRTEALAKELLKDRAYFHEGGGVTLSGGEALLQHGAARDLAAILHGEGVHVAVDTAGCCAFSRFEEILPYVDLILYDIKIFNVDEHKRITGADNHIILENYEQLARRHVPLWVRTPIIEGATDGEANIMGIGAFLAALPLPEQWELCAFNNLCKDKYERLSQDWAYSGAALIGRDKMTRLEALARRFVPAARATGRTAA
ncbi:MAG: glycyl-radical enzyme activating protein [Treponema sp.]|nr:glycyl-radical enzyme activating protein [Treponema sp.]